MKILILITTHLNNFLLLQPGELPVPKDSKPNQKFGAYNIMDFIQDKWFYLLAILFMVFLLWYYFRDKKKEEQLKKEEQDRANMN